MVAHLFYRPDGATVFRVPYDARWVAGIKASVPASARDWNPVAKVWTVLPPHGRAIVALTFTVFGRVEVEGEPARFRPRPAPIRTMGPAYQALHLLPSAPRCVVDAAYRALSREHHPDLLAASEQTRAHAAMVDLNAAYEALKARGAA